ncbi:hypothetical protein PQJ75_06625 [Rhodoplanes sp. TEM]|uniref:DUF1736 domain-containing protein n=1 Tax=Rhodoplanes tepidamans TaxID=200616 RepID=A0ABT5J3V4_RHOTP|nr:MULTISPECIES: hypothetical protein [Rhodoplanes]MDC7784335.1 hypothetical protein [Rhodoplanes tepidamans]MDC7983401.1 hypothetical protein [Rhodoplanes sp. TEM]MDQ0354537.1 hypothetical protein [Rhodoplanes tepidamans]
MSKTCYWSSWALLLVITFFSVHLFLAGYRLTADDVLYHQVGLGGFRKAWEFTRGAAAAQGRIGHYLDVGLSVLSAPFVDFYAFRVLYTGLYYSTFYLFGYYVSLLGGGHLGLVTALLLVSHHALDYYHLPPNSYPFHISVPIAAIILSRIVLLHRRREETTRSEWPMLALMGAGAIFNEKAFAFCIALLFVEKSWAVVQDSERVGLRLAVLGRLRSRSTWADIAPLVGVVLVYAVFRAAHPSSYEGNQLSPSLIGIPFFKTMLGHMFGGSAPGTITRMLDEYRRGGGGPSDWNWMSVAIVSFSTLGVARLVLRSEANDGGARPRYFVLVAIFLLAAMMVTAPVAIVEKYQNWCQAFVFCMFVDTRLSFVFLGGAGASFILGLNRIARTTSLSNAVTWSLAFLLAVLAALVFSRNTLLERDMRDYVSGWERAKLLACVSDDDLDARRQELPSLIEPRKRISFHPNFDVAAYWLAYVRSTRGRIDCGTAGPMDSTLGGLAKDR